VYCAIYTHATLRACHGRPKYSFLAPFGSCEGSCAPMAFRKLVGGLSFLNGIRSTGTAASYATGNLPGSPPLWMGLHRRGRTVPPSARRSSVGRDCVPRDPSGLDRGRSRSRRAVANVRWGALNEGGASRRAPDKCPQRVVPATPRCLSLHVDFTRRACGRAAREAKSRRRSCRSWPDAVGAKSLLRLHRQHGSHTSPR
jgi:hypothetical protein